ncbi:hypothetical protein M0Q50_10730 [bacterium]|jgi:hypothetical protein|nr:hypothetical protein [bacterium]
MGCDIHTYVEVRENDIWEYFYVKIFSYTDYNRGYIKNSCCDPFGWRSYTMFSFLGDVRNYNGIQPIKDNIGLPKDISKDVKEIELQDSDDNHSHSYITLKELIEYDYDISYKSTNYTDGDLLTEDDIYVPRDNLNDLFFIHIEELKQLGEPDDVRIVFWFDN